MIEARDWECRALGRRWPYSLFVPAAPPPADGWPVLFVLHGAGRNHRAVVDDRELRTVVEQLPATVVFPDGGLSWYVDSPVVAGSRFQAMLGELLELIRATQPVARAAARTGICGWSMGGFGAVRFAQDYPHLIGAVGSIIGLLDFPNPQLPVDQNYPMPAVFGSDVVFWERVNCTTTAARLTGKQITLIAAREAFDYRMNQNFQARLESLRIAHQYIEVAGGHDWPTVVAALPRLFEQILSINA